MTCSPSSFLLSGFVLTALVFFSLCTHGGLWNVQDEVLTVIRRVDDNWAEGMLGDKIGIFPLLYVEVRLLSHLHPMVV